MTKTYGNFPINLHMHNQQDIKRGDSNQNVPVPVGPRCCSRKQGV